MNEKQPLDIQGTAHYPARDYRALLNRHVIALDIHGNVVDRGRVIETLESPCQIDHARLDTGRYHPIACLVYDTSGQNPDREAASIPDPEDDDEFADFEANLFRYLRDRFSLTKGDQFELGEDAFFLITCGTAQPSQALRSKIQKRLRDAYINRCFDLGGFKVLIDRMHICGASRPVLFFTRRH